LTATLISNATHGELTFNSDGSFEYLVEPAVESSAVELEILCENDRSPAGP
jgi:hypothetical protein